MLPTALVTATLAGPTEAPLLAELNLAVGKARAVLVCNTPVSETILISIFGKVAAPLHV